jgi:hypothetical protein
LFFVLQYWGLNSGPTTWATPPAHFCDRFFWDWVLQTICLVWLSRVARITGVSHQCPAHSAFEIGSSVCLGSWVARITVISHHVWPCFFFFFFCGTGFELRASHLLGRCSYHRGWWALVCFFWGRVSLYILGWPWTHCVSQASLKLEIFLPKPPEC